VVGLGSGLQDLDVAALLRFVGHELVARQLERTGFTVANLSPPIGPADSGRTSLLRLFTSEARETSVDLGPLHRGDRFVWHSVRAP